RRGTGSSRSIWCARHRRCRGSSAIGWLEMVRDACAVVLAGGESRRFGSDKALAQFRGEPLISRVVRELRAAGFAQVALAAKDPDKYEAVAGGAELLHDVRPIQTPLAGLAAGLRASRYPPALACAPDMPFAAARPLIDAPADPIP